MFFIVQVRYFYVFLFFNPRPPPPAPEFGGRQYRRYEFSVFTRLPAGREFGALAKTDSSRRRRSSPCSPTASRSSAHRPPFWSPAGWRATRAFGTWLTRSTPAKTPCPRGWKSFFVLKLRRRFRWEVSERFWSLSRRHCAEEKKA